MNKKINFEYILLIIILVVGFLIRLYKINNPIADWHSWRQADTASVTKIYLQNGINILVPKFHDISSIQSGILNLNGYRMVEFPVYNFVSAVVSLNLKFFSLEVWSRLVTISCSIVTAFFLYLIGKRFIGIGGGLLAAFFYLFIPFNIYFTRVILPDPMGVMFAIVSIWAFAKYCDFENHFYFYTSALFFALALLIKPYLGFYLLPIAYLFFDKFGIKKVILEHKLQIKIIIYILTISLPFLLWRWWESKFPSGIPFFWWAFDGDGIRFRPAFWYWIFGERIGHLILGSFGLIPFAFGMLLSKNSDRSEPKAKYFISSLLVGMIVYFVVVATANVKHDYYQILIIPVIALTASAGSVYLWTNNIFNKLISRAVLIFSILVMIVTGWNLIAGDYVINHPEIIEAGHEIDRITPKNAIIIAPYTGDTAFLYQTNRRGWPAIDDSIDNIIKEGASYYVSVDLNSADTKMIESRFKTIERTDKFIIINLLQPLINK